MLKDTLEFYLPAKKNIRYKVIVGSGFISFMQKPISHQIWEPIEPTQELINIAREVIIPMYPNRR